MTRAFLAGLAAVALLTAYSHAQTPPAPPQQPSTEQQVIYQRLGVEIDRGIKLEAQALDLSRELQKVRAELAQTRAELEKQKKPESAPKGDNPAK